MQVQQGRVFIGRLPHHGDLLMSLTDLCRQENIRLGVFSVIGALTGARLGYYNQNTRNYIECLRLDERLEIVSATGNISLKDSQIFVHSHIILSNDQGATYGGHLVEGCMIFAAEYCIRELTGGELVRQEDSQTGLSLWPLSNTSR